MKKLINLVLMLLIMAAFTACSTSYRYYTAGEDDINLNRYKTFTLIKKLENRKPDTIVQDSKDLGKRLNYVNNNRYYNTPAATQKIKETAIAALRGKGLVLQETNPDLLVRYSTIVDRGARNSYAYPGFFGGPFGWGGWGYGYGWRFNPYFYGGWGGWGGFGGGMPVRQTFKQGVLAIELIDNRTQQTIWIGYGAGELSRDPEKSIAQLPQVVTDIFKRLPVNR